MENNETSVSRKKCKICGHEKQILEFSKNPNAKDGRNSVCVDCRGNSALTQRGRQRFQRERDDLETEVEKQFQLFKLGDPKKDFLIRQYLIIALTPGTNQQSQLAALGKIGEIHGLTKETPKSDLDLIHEAFQRKKAAAMTGAYKP